LNIQASGLGHPIQQLSTHRLLPACVSKRLGGFPDSGLATIRSFFRSGKGAIDFSFPARLIKDGAFLSILLQTQ